MKQFDAIIIGFGKGGKTLASELALHGWTVAMIDNRTKCMGVPASIPDVSRPKP